MSPVGSDLITWIAKHLDVEDHSKNMFLMYFVYENVKQS